MLGNVLLGTASLWCLSVAIHVIRTSYPSWGKVAVWSLLAGVCTAYTLKLFWSLYREIRIVPVHCVVVLKQGQLEVSERNVLIRRTRQYAVHAREIAAVELRCPRRAGELLYKVYLRPTSTPSEWRCITWSLDKEVASRLFSECVSKLEIRAFIDGAEKSATGSPST